MNMLEEALAWYLAPWRRVSRGVFNVVLALATLPSLLLGVYGMAEGAGGLLAPLADMTAASRHLQAAMEGAPPPDVQGLEKALQHMQGAGEGFEKVGQAPTPFPWGTVLDMAIWLALVPLVHMRLRDMGAKTPARLWGWTAAVYAPMAHGWLGSLVGVFVLGGWGFVASVVGFVALGWLCLAPTHKHTVTTEGNSGKMPADEHDPYPPFWP